MMNSLRKGIISKNFNKTQRKVSTSIAATTTSKQKISQNNELTIVDIDLKTKIATITLNRLPANALNFELMTSIKNSINELEAKKVNGIILTSASDRIFSAGLDLKETYQTDKNHLVKLWISLQDMWKALFPTPIPTAALINGHALAGGCVLATACDYRVMLPKFTIGLNETRAGIAAPQFVMDTYLNVVSSRRIAEADLIEGKCYKTEDALTVGLIDAAVDSREHAFEKCMEFLRLYEGPTKLAKAQTKLSFREKIVFDFEKNRKEDLDLFVNGIQRPEVQQFLGNYLKGLKEKTVKNTI